MNTRLITNAEIVQRQEDIRLAARRARRELTVSGIRQIVGSTFIAMGVKMHGCIDEQRKAIIVPPTPASARSM